MAGVSFSTRLQPPVAALTTALRCLVNEKIVSTRHVNLNVAQGAKTGPPLVMLHGVTRRWQDFLPLLPSLTLRWEIHGIDFRGHGLSGRVKSAYRAIDYVSDVVSYLRQALDEPAVLLGHSLGAMVAAAVAAEEPELVQAIVLEDPPFEVMGLRLRETMFHDLFLGYQPLAGSALPIDELTRKLAEVRVGRGNGVGLLPSPRRLGDVRDEPSLRFHAACLKQLAPEVLDPIVACRWLEGYETERVLQQVTCPVLFLRGDFLTGGALPDDYAESLIARLRYVTARKFQGVGHGIHSSATIEMANCVAGFLESLDG